MPVPPPLPDLPTTLRPATLYAKLAAALLDDIRAGRYAIGDALPAEPVLQERFGVSRHTVRQALRELKEMGVISSHSGIGTLVRGQPDEPRFVHASPSIEDLLNFAGETRLRVVERSDVVSDSALAALLGCPAGQAWCRLKLLRYVATGRTAIGQVTVYLRPEFASVAQHIESSGQPIFKLVESQHGVRLAEIQQRIDSVVLDAGAAKLLRAEEGSAALQITRRYLDDKHRLMQISQGIYPSGRFSFVSTMRIQRGAARGDK